MLFTTATKSQQGIFSPLILTQLQLKVFQLGLTSATKWVMTGSHSMTSVQMKDIPLCTTNALCIKIAGKKRQSGRDSRPTWSISGLTRLRTIWGESQLWGSSEDTCGAAVHATFTLCFSFAHFLHALQEVKQRNPMARLPCPITLKSSS